MPKGIIVFEWNSRSGMEILGAYPPAIAISEPLRLQIFQMHEYSGEAGIVSIFNEGVSVVSFYSGAATGTYIVLVLFADEVQNRFEEILNETSPAIVSGRRSRDLEGVLKDQFNRIVQYAGFTKEQMLAHIYNDEKRRKILGNLRQLGAVPKGELEIWLKDAYPRDYINVDATCALFFNYKMVRSAMVKEIEYYVLVQDLYLSRVPPPAGLLGMKGKERINGPIRRKYLAECRDYFAKYDPLAENEQILIDFVLDPGIYKILNILRNSFFNPQANATAETSKNLDMKKLDRLVELNFASIIENKGERIYALKSDIVIGTYFPESILDVILKNYADAVYGNDVILGHLGILREFYNEEVRPNDLLLT